jgi:protein SCO1/2
MCAMKTPNQTATPADNSSKRDWLRWAGGGALAPLLASTTVAAPSPMADKPGPRAHYFPNSLLQTHDGKKLRFYDDIVKGKIVIFNMMYSVCTGICPGSTANLREVQRLLAPRLGKDVFMYSLTLQPQFDTPEALSSYVNSYDLKPGWTFLTGQPNEMDAIRRKLGFFNDDPRIDADLENHTGMVRVGNETLDRWFMLPALSNPKQMAREIMQM